VKDVLGGEQAEHEERLVGEVEEVPGLDEDLVEIEQLEAPVILGLNRGARSPRWPWA
jgi:hypothetical protein